MARGHRLPREPLAPSEPAAPDPPGGMRGAGAGRAPADAAWDEVGRLFDEALARAPADRERWLALSGASEAVRAEVAAMLRAHEQPGGLLDREPPAPSPDPRAAPLHPAELARRLEDALADRYIVERELGRGGAATVFLAHERKHARPVVLKVLNPEVARLWGHDRFEREVQIAARLSHPHILGLIDSGDADGLLYYVMPYVAGETLRARLDREGALPVAVALTLLRDVADALAHAHHAGVVHRDLKPANVLCVADHAFLMDFGVAKLITPTVGGPLTGQGFAVGTPAYMAPEQVEAGSVDGRADLYAWGLLAYEMLAGELPPAGAPAPRLAARRADVPHLLSELVAACLGADPRERPDDADAVLAWLGTLAEPRPRQRTVTVGVHARRALVAGARRRVALAGLTGALLVAGAVGTAAWRRGERAAAVAEPFPSPVAVAALANETGDPALDSWGRMAGDWITQGLQQTGVVKVVPWLSALNAVEAVRAERAAGRQVDPVQRIGEETGAATVITGSYYLVNDSLQFRAEIADARRGSVLHALTPIVVSRDSAHRAIRLLRERLMGAAALISDDRVARASEIARRPPSFGAYEAFDRGLQRYLAQDWAASAADFRQAFALDTTFLTPLMYALNAYWSLGEHARMDSLLLVLGPRRGELTTYGQHILASLEARLAGDGERAREALFQAIHDAPGSRATYGFAAVSIDTDHAADALSALDDLDTARAEVRGSPSYWTSLTHALHLTGAHGRELAAARAMRALLPDRRIALVLEARALAALGRTAALDSLFAAARALPPTTYWSQGAAMVVAGQELQAHGRTAAGDRWLAEGARWLQTQLALAPTDRAHRWWLASALYGLGRWPEAERIFSALAAEQPERLDARAHAALAAAHAGALDAEQRLGAPAPHERGAHTAYRARLAAIRSDHVLAAALLADAVRLGVDGLPWLHATARRDLEPLLAARVPLPASLRVR